MPQCGAVQKRKMVFLQNKCITPCSAQCCCRVIDFGAGWFDLNWAFGQQKAFNAPGKSPAMCSEF